MNIIFLVSVSLRLSMTRQQRDERVRHRRRRNVTQRCQQVKIPACARRSIVASDSCIHAHAINARRNVIAIANEMSHEKCTKTDQIMTSIKYTFRKKAKFFNTIIKKIIELNVLF